MTDAPHTEDEPVAESYSDVYRDVVEEHMTPLRSVALSLTFLAWSSAAWHGTVATATQYDALLGMFAAGMMFGGAGGFADE